MNLKSTSWLSMGAFLIVSLSDLPATAQTYICTNHSYANGLNSVTFNVENTNNFPIKITEIKTALWMGQGVTDQFTLLYNTTPVNSSGSTWTQGTIGVGQNGWISGGTASVAVNSHTEPQTILTGLSIIIPANTTYGFALGAAYQGSIGYQTLSSGVNSFNNGGVIVKTGDNISWGGYAFPAVPHTYPRGWNGCIGWVNPSCNPPAGLTVSNINSSTANISWTSGGSGVTGYEYAVTTNNTPPASGTATTSTSINGVSYTPGQINYLHVRSNCGTSGFSAWATKAFPGNDHASGAYLLTLGAGCSGNPYDNTNASHSVGEPYPSCNNYSTGHHTVWFKFVAPSSGAVKVTTDFFPGGTLQDTKIALFSATDVNNYATFSIISCNEDGGVLIDYNSILFATGLTNGQTYYVAVDGWSTSDFGTFCIAAYELNSNMIPSSSSNCQSLEIPEEFNPNYTGWVSLLTSGGQLVALVRNPAGGEGADFVSSLTLNAGSIRSSNGQPYLDRNYRINNAVVSSPVDIQLFFLNSELLALSNAIGGAGVALSGLNITKQSGTLCQSSYNPSLGTNGLIMQNGNGNANGVSWISGQTSSFSNFYIHGGTNPLEIRLGEFSAVNVGHTNRIDWNTRIEQDGDYFELERGDDGRQFSKLNTIKANGSASKYSFWDESPLNGTSYYRLKMFDKSGSFAYSDVVNATLKDGKGLIVEAYPNPVNEILSVNVYGNLGANATVSITDITGKVISVSSIESGKAEFKMAGIAPGVYLIKFSDSRETRTIKITKD